MSKKNTIFTAIIINAVLLVLLFCSAVNSEESFEDTAFSRSTEKSSSQLVEGISEKKKEPSLSAKEDKLLELHRSTDSISKKEKEARSALLRENKGSSKGSLPNCEVSSHLQDACSQNSSVEKTLRQKPFQPEKEAPSLTKQQEKATYYTVQVGDNPWNIARKHRMKVKELLKKNNLDEKAARNIKPGDQLLVKEPKTGVRG